MEEPATGSCATCAARLYDSEHPEAAEAVNAEPDDPLLAALAAASVEGR